MNDSTFFTIGALAVVAVIAVPVGTTIAWNNAEQTQTCTVENKDRASTSTGSEMRVYTDCGIFRVADTLWQGQWDSADKYAELAIGDTYQLTTVGWRFPFFSDFPNIIEVAAA